MVGQRKFGSKPFRLHNYWRPNKKNFVQNYFGSNIFGQKNLVYRKSVSKSISGPKILGRKILSEINCGKKLLTFKKNLGPKKS